MKKRVLTALLAVIMVVSLGTVSALADNTVVMSAEELIFAADNARDGDVITLGANIVMDPTNVSDPASEGLEPLVTIRSDITLNLNGKTISLDTSKSEEIEFPYALSFFSIDGAQLTVIGEGVIDAEADYNTAYCFDVINNGTLVIENGTYYGAMTVAQVENGRLKIYGGTFDLAKTIKAEAPQYSKYIINAIDPSYKEDSAQIAIYGGEYVGFNPSSNPEGDGTSYVTVGAIVTETDAGDEFGVSANTTRFDNAVAVVNRVYYDDLQDAFDAALTGDTVTLLCDHTINTAYDVNRGIIFDLGGNTLTLEYAVGTTNAVGLNFKNGNSILTNGTIMDARSKDNTVCGWITAYVNGKASLTTGNIELYSYQPSSTANYNYILRATATSDGAGTLTLNEGTIIAELPKTDATKDTYGVVGVGVFGPYDNGNNVPANYTGETLIVNDGVFIETTGFAISGNGTTHGTTIVINGGSIISTGSTGIYHPQAGTLEINGGEITGAMTGIEARAGEVTMSGGTVTGLGTPTSVDPNGNGTTSTGAGIAIAQHTTKLPISVTVTGGVINGYSAIYENNPQENGTDSIAKIEIDIEGGEFNAINGSTVPVYSEDFKGFISGGLYSHSVTEYVNDALNYELAGDKFSYYETIELALIAAQPGDSVNFIGTLPEGETELNTVKYIDGEKVITYTVPDSTEIKLPNASRSGYIFLGWRSGDKTFSAGERVVVSADVTFTAVWGNLPDTAGTYPITVADPANGDVSVNLPNASAGAAITVTAVPDEGYELAYITVDGERISGTSFTMPDHAVTVSAVFVLKGLPFADVSAGAWYFDAVSYVYANGLMEGVSDTAFEPGGGMTRAMVWAILARVDGVSVTGSNWAETARSWAMAEGVSDGENASAPVTREQLVTMLWRFAGEPAVDFLFTAKDADAVSGWAYEAMRWAAAEGIIEGDENGMISPADGATRAQCAAILMRYVEA